MIQTHKNSLFISDFSEIVFVSHILAQSVLDVVGQKGALKIYVWRPPA